MMIKLISIPQIDWKTYIDTYKEIVGESPTRDLDTNGIVLQDPSAFLYCDSNIQSIYPVIFLAKVDSFLALELCKIDNVSILVKEVNRYDVLMYMTSMIKHWKRAITDYEDDKKLKEILKYIKTQINKIGGYDANIQHKIRGR